MLMILSDSPFELMALSGTSELRPLEEESDTYPSNPRQTLLSKPTPLAMRLERKRIGWSRGTRIGQRSWHHTDSRNCELVGLQVG